MKHPIVPANLKPSRKNSNNAKTKMSAAAMSLGLI
jgi:hypothetical protein